MGPIGLIAVMIGPQARLLIEQDEEMHGQPDRRAIDQQARPPQQ